MLLNYLKLAWRVLTRRKFFTLISLFGISFTLGLLMTILSFLQTELGSNAPLTAKNDMVYLSHISLSTNFYDTLVIVDTLMDQGIAVYDTTYDYKESGSSMSQTQFSHSVIQDYLMDMPSARNMTMFSTSISHDVYVNGVKLSLDMMVSDENYWSILDHKILEGRVFDKQEVEDAAQVIVISTKVAENYFGKKEDVIDEEMVIDGKVYRVIGLYEHLGRIIEFVSPDVVTPYTTIDYSARDNFYFGPFELIYQKGEGATIDRLKDDINHASTKIPIDHPDNEDDFKEVTVYPKTYNEMYAQGMYYEEDATKSYGIMKWFLIGLVSFFILLPTLNLINLNVSRIMDRSSEIGVRKAFGANQGNIIFQFIIENIVQTILGGLIGLVIAIAIINIINSGGYLGNSILRVNAKFFIYSLMATIFFGVLSGLLPAYRMSKLQIVQALKENQL